MTAEEIANHDQRVQKAFDRVVELEVDRAPEEKIEQARKVYEDLTGLPMPRPNATSATPLSDITQALKEVRQNQPTVSLPDAQAQAKRVMKAARPSGAPKPPQPPSIGEPAKIEKVKRHYVTFPGIGARLRQARELAAYGSRELSIALGLRKSAIKEIEGREEVGEKRVDLIARFLNVNPIWLKSGIGEMAQEGGLRIKFSAAGHETRKQLPPVSGCGTASGMETTAITAGSFATGLYVIQRIEVNRRVFWNCEGGWYPDRPIKAFNKSELLEEIGKLAEIEGLQDMSIRQLFV